MLRYLLIIVMLLLFTACSELKIIGGSAMRELKAEGVNAEVYHLSKK